MNGIVKKVQFENIIKYFCVLWIILSSGAVLYTLYNMKLSMLILLFLAIICLFCSDRERRLSVNKFNIIRFFIIFYVLAINTLINLDKGFSVNDAVIMVIRLLSLVLIIGSFTKQEFVTKFIHCMFGLAIISLISWILVVSVPGLQLPFYTQYYAKGQWFPGTFYFLYKYEEGIIRNMGVFWEPGVYQAYLNIALLFCTDKIGSLADKKDDVKKYILIYVVLFLTILTTQSTTGYLCLTLSIAYYLFGKQKTQEENAKSNSGMKKLLFVLVIIVVFMYTELKLGIIEDKLINQGGSYTMRMNDTMGSLYLAQQNPVTGLGMFNEVQSEIQSTVSIENTSSGIGTLLIRMGFFLFTVYCIFMYRGIKRFLGNNIVQNFLAFLIFMVILSSQAIGIMTVFLMFFFVFKSEKNISI